jgi:hypothetical protein
VQRGDTLSEIARDYGNGKTYQQLAAINNIPNPDLIYIGQKIYLSKSTSTSTKSTDAKTVTIKQFGQQADMTDSLFATWTWSKSNTKHYEVRWDYYTADKTWFVGSDTTTEYKYSTFSIPSNAKQVRFKVRPISKTYKDGDKETVYWTADWTSWQKHSVARAPKVPSGLSMQIEEYKLTAEVNNVDDASIIEFDVVKDDAKSIKIEKVKVVTSRASYSCTIAAGGRYKVRCRAYKDGVYSDWSDYTSNVNTIPATPSALTKCEASSDSSIRIEWSRIENATSYEIQYTTDKSYFDSSSETPGSDTTEETFWELVNISQGEEYFFRVRAVNNEGSSGWSEVSSTAVGRGPSAPTTWSSTTTAVAGEPLTFYWVHNAKDGSSQTYATLELRITGVDDINGVVGDEVVMNEITKTEVDVDDKTVTYTIKNSTSEDEKNKTSFCTINTSKYGEGAKIQWRVKTAGVTNATGDWSIERAVNIYAPATMEMTVTDLDGNAFETLTSFPFSVSALAGPTTQRPVGYYLSITANDVYETIDELGNTKLVNRGDVVYSKHFDISGELEVDISAGDVNLENNISYTLTCLASMDSGLTAEASSTFTVEWEKVAYVPNAEISVNSDTYSATIRPYCATYDSVIYKVTRNGTTYTKTTDTIDGVCEQTVPQAKTTTGEQVYWGTTSDGEQVFYCIVEEMSLIEDVLLAVYRREFDGSFVELASGLDGSKGTHITDPHPALDYARYRIVATDKTTGAVGYYDTPGLAIGGTSVIIQWDEEWSNFDTYGSEDDLEEPAWTGSLLKLPYNIEVSDKHASDVALVKYIGRKRPVSYYGTQLGETSTWNVVIDKKDKETLYALRRLSIWMGNVYVREPSGSGYWANVSVSFNQKYDELTIPITIEVTRVEGGA